MNGLCLNCLTDASSVLILFQKSVWTRAGSLEINVDESLVLDINRVISIEVRYLYVSNWAVRHKYWFLMIYGF